MNSSFDNDIRNALQSNSDVQHAGDEGLFQQLTSTFRSRMRYWMALMWGMTLAMTGVAVWMAILFFQAEATRDMILFATVFLYAAMAIGMLKMWAWMEMNRNTHTREIKRIEVQIARLTEQLSRK